MIGSNPPMSSKVIWTEWSSKREEGEENLHVLFDRLRSIEHRPKRREHSSPGDFDYSTPDSTLRCHCPHCSSFDEHSASSHCCKHRADPDWEVNIWARETRMSFQSGELRTSFVWGPCFWRGVPFVRAENRDRRWSRGASIRYLTTSPKWKNWRHVPRRAV